MDEDPHCLPLSTFQFPSAHFSCFESPLFPLSANASHTIHGHLNLCATEKMKLDATLGGFRAIAVMAVFSKWHAVVVVGLLQGGTGTGGMEGLACGAPAVGEL